MKSPFERGRLDTNIVKAGVAVSIDTVRDWDIAFEEIHSPGALERHWRELEARSECSFFQSWAWIGPWLELVVGECQPLLLRARHGGRTAGLAALGRRALRRWGFLSRRRLLVSETGNPAYDTLTVEHNGLLLEAGEERATVFECLQFLAGQTALWDELVIGGLAGESVPLYLGAAMELGLRSTTLTRHPYFYIDLDTLRVEGRDYLSSLSANTRQQIRRAMRSYRSRGSLELRIAEDAAEARNFFSELRRLHQIYWTTRGYAGAFSNEPTVSFHERLIEAGLPLGLVQLARVSTGKVPIAYLYNFVHRGTVYNYQAGLSYEAEPRLKPGLVAHALIAQHSLERGHRRYDLLMGDQRYKRSLASSSGEMSRLRIRRQRARLWPVAAAEARRGQRAE